MEKIVNTVPAEGQMICSSEISMLGCEDAPLKILIVGNSITRHGPKAEIGWHGDWGMAASAPEKDYVHRLYDMLRESGVDARFYVRQASHWERNFTDPSVLSKYENERAFCADIVIFRLGENVLNETLPSFQAAAKAFIEYLTPENGRAIFTTGFWNKPARDDLLRELARERGETCVELACTDDGLMALGKFEHKGVAAHPGDEGMEMIAKKLHDAILSTR